MKNYQNKWRDINATTGTKGNGKAQPKKEEVKCFSGQFVKSLDEDVKYISNALQCPSN